MQNKILIVVFLFLFDSCAMQTPQQQEPFVLSGVFSDSGKLSQQIQPKELWWQSFNDPELNNRITEALANNFSIRIAEKRLAQAEAEARQAGASLIPEITLHGSTSSTRDHSQNRENIGDTDNTKNAKSSTSSTTNKFSLSLAASYELDLWGRVRNRRAAATDQFLATKDDLQTAVLSIAAEVAETWFACIKNREQQQLVKKQRQLNCKNAEIIELQVMTGSAQIADLLQQRQLIETNTASLVALESTGKMLANKLHILLGQPPQSKTLKKSGKNNKEYLPTLPLLPPLPATGIPANTLQNRPDVHAAWLAFTAADALTAAAMANRLPKFSLSADISTSAERSRDLFNNWLSNIAVGLLAPVIDGGNRAREVEKQQAITSQKFYAWKQSILNAAGEVENALLQEKNLAKQYDSIKKQEEFAAQTVELVTTRYRQGSGSYQRVLSAQISRQKLQQSLLDIRLELLTNRITLYRALSCGIPQSLLGNKE